MKEDKPEQYIEQEEYGYITIFDRIVNPSTIVSLIAAIFLILGLVAPIIDFTSFHENVDIQYNLIKVCKNVGILSPIWNGVPYGVVVGIVMLVVLSFVNIPPLKIIPSVLIIVIYVIILADIGNVIEWGNQIIERVISGNVIIISKSSIADGIMYGAYFTAVGIILALISCILKGAKISKE